MLRVFQLPSKSHAAGSVVGRRDSVEREPLSWMGTIWIALYVAIYMRRAAKSTYRAIAMRT
jgi:hypothetical protein